MDYAIPKETLAHTAMNTEIPEWQQSLLKRPVMNGWKIWGFWVFRRIMIKHFVKGDIGFGRLCIVLLPMGLRPKNFDYHAGMKNNL